MKASNNEGWTMGSETSFLMHVPKEHTLGSLAMELPANSLTSLSSQRMKPILVRIVFMTANGDGIIMYEQLL